jgi:hypothetical protein
MYRGFFVCRGGGGVARVTSPMMHNQLWTISEEAGRSQAGMTQQVITATIK